MNFRGSGRYIPRYDTTPPPESESEEDVGDLNFDDVFAHGHDQQRQQQQHHHQNNQHGQRLLQQQHGNQPRAPPTPAADPGHHGIAPQETRAFGYRAPGGYQANANTNHEEEEQLIFDLDLEDDANDDYVYNDHHRRRHAAPPVEDGPGENLRRRQECIEELSAEVVRQQRYVNHLREKLQFGPFPEADGGREGVRGALGMAQEALRTLREALMDAELEGEQRGDRLERGDRHRLVGGRLVEEAGGENNGHGSGDAVERRRGRGRARRRQQGPDPAARRQTEQNLAQLRETEMQMRWAGATPEDLRHVVEEIKYLQDVLDGRYLTWGRGKSLSPSSTTASASSTSSSPATSASPITSPPPSPFSAASPNHHRRRHRRRHRHHPKPKHDRTTGCYHPFPALSQQDPRLPPLGVARTEPIELHDAEGPRYLALVTLDNPDPAARRAEEQAVAQGRRAFARYEAGWFTVVQRALACRALTVLSVGPRGAICVVQEGRLDVLGAILKAHEEPFGVKSWTFLGVGVGGAEGFVFCLHKPEEEEGEKKEGGSGGSDDLE
ncbi:hypothetical protein BFW01_g2636 [Lasiodiplodia theobromae]|nr:hypothetical protein BFW01_g2636 [Lasiodiplodia theobromae]